MPPELTLLPERASEIAERIDDLFLIWVLIAALFSVLIAALLLYFGLKYRRRAPAQVGLTPPTPVWLEIAWCAIPLVIALSMGAWGADVFFSLSRPPADAVQYFVIGRQWMWKAQHPDGRREINELHVPVGRAILLTMTSEDVIHSFFVPAFRVKNDAVPGRYTTVWFRATKPGVYHLFCAEYCGTEHSKMIGRVIVMAPFQYEEWLAGAKPARAPAALGEDLFTTHGCPTCHRPDTAARGPILTGLLGRAVSLQGGAVVTADENYIRESILTPAAKVVLGYQPIMPAYQGRLSEDDVIQLITYIRSLSDGAGAPAAAPPAATERLP